MNKIIRIRVKGQNLQLLPQKAIYWEEEKALIISDLHLGKITYFRKEGVPVPANGVEKNFIRLSELMREYNVQRIIFTGDLFHGKENDEWNLFREWRKNHSSADMDIVMGNHDHVSRSSLENVAMVVNECELTIPPFTFCHHPQDVISFDKYFISGHIHPVFSVQGLANQSVRLPCFYFGRMQAILPSFGYFTGGYEIKRHPGDMVYLVLDNSVVEVK
jgi:DNA ligase-associated metallophosphoesterase